MPPLDVMLITDPACPFAFSAEPARIRLRWHYGDGLRWTVRMIVLTREPRATPGSTPPSSREHPAGADAYWTA